MRHQILLQKYDIIWEFGETRLVAQSCTKLAQDCAKVVQMKIQKVAQKFEEEQNKGPYLNLAMKSQPALGLAP